jgi:thiosulfate dehydrogenase
MRSLVALSLLSLSLFAAACGDQQVPAADFGRGRFSDPKVSTSRFNTFSCATCHVVDAAAPVVAPGRLDPGYNLAGAPSRGGWWGNGSTTLLDAVNVCLKEFMGGAPLARDAEVTRQLDAYLEAGTPPAGTPAPFTLVRSVGPLANLEGDATRGREAYQKACFRCHGEAHTWKDHTTSAAVAIPEATQATFGALARDVTVEKIRHGRFFNIGGVMPLYTVEAMSDDTVADILAFMGL